MFTALLEKLVRYEDLTEAEAAAAMREVMEGRAQPAPLAALLASLAMKGERPAEIVGFARTMREHAVKLSKPAGAVFDTCGTGGDRCGTFNISSAAALVVASCGVTVAKHGNRSVSSRCGSADVFEQLGVNIAAPPPVIERTLHDANIAFFFAPTFHPSMKHAGPTRRELGIRTAFNLLGPLTNPAGATRQIVGVPRSELTQVLAQALVLLGSERAWVVHGADGVDELSTTGYTKVSECRGGTVNTFYVHPSDFGLSKATLADLKGGDAAENAAIVWAVLDGRRGPQREVVLLNAGAALMVAGRVQTVREGIARAASAIDTGAAKATLETMVRSSQAPLDPAPGGEVRV
jgi:anthranilate phosphoribosyltransferase